jgi:hypothetical protein
MIMTEEISDYNLVHIPVRPVAKAARQRPDDRDDRHADAFRELETDIRDLVLAVDLGMLAASSDKANLMLFALHQIGPMATALKAKYYELWG